MSPNSLDNALNPWRYNADGGLTPQAMAQDGATIPAGASGGGGGGSSGGMNVDPGALKNAAGAAGGLMDKLNKDGRVADDTTTAAAGALSQEKFQLGPALKNTGGLWYSQVTTLVQACHKIEQNLAATAKGDQMMEDRNEMSMKDIAKNFY